MSMTTTLKKVDFDEGEGADPWNDERGLTNQYIDSISHDTARLMEVTGVSAEAAASIAGAAAVAAKLEMILHNHHPARRKQ